MKTTEEKLRKSLRYSELDGMFASVTTGVTERFITPYALAMHATNTQIGVLSSIPNLMGALAQLKSASLIEWLGSRRALINSCVLASAFMWIPIIAVPYLFMRHAVWWLIAFFSVYTMLNSIDMPAWTSLMSEHVPEDRWGSYFGWRNKFLGVISAAASLVAGLALTYFRTSAFMGFTVLFSVACIARFIAWNFLIRMYEPPLAVTTEDRFGFIQFLMRVQTSNFVRFVLFVAVVDFSVYIASPFFAVYMLRDLKMSYVVYTMISLASVVSTLIMTKIWGTHADRVGNRRVLRLTSMCIPLIPFLWLFSKSAVYLFIVQVYSGFFWAGFRLSAGNFIFDAVSPAKRPRCIAYFNVIDGLAICIGALMGGLLLKIIPPFLGYRIITLFLISGVMRACSAMLGSLVKEVRPVRHVSNLDLFYSVAGIKPL